MKKFVSVFLTAAMAAASLTRLSERGLLRCPYPGYIK